MSINGEAAQERRQRHFEATVLRDMDALPGHKGVTWESSGVGFGFSAVGLPITIMAVRSGIYEGFVAGHPVHTGKARSVAIKCLEWWEGRADLHAWWSGRCREGISHGTTTPERSC